MPLVVVVVASLLVGKGAALTVRKRAVDAPMRVGRCILLVGEDVKGRILSVGDEMGGGGVL